MRVMPFAMMVKFTVRCSEAGCFNEFWLETRTLAFNETLMPAPPDNWRNVDGALVCPRHKVEIRTSKVE